MLMIIPGIISEFNLTPRFSTFISIPIAFSPNPSMAQPTSLSSITHQDSPSPISSQNSTSGDDNSIYTRNQQQQKKKGIRNSLGRLFTRKPGSMDNKPMHESIHQPVSSYQQHYPSPYTTRGIRSRRIYIVF